MPPLAMSTRYAAPCVVATRKAVFVTAVPEPDTITTPFAVTTSPVGAILDVTPNV
jgi:hypothetical protein